MSSTTKETSILINATDLRIPVDGYSPPSHVRSVVMVFSNQLAEGLGALPPPIHSI